MPEDDELIRRSRAVRAQAAALIAWSAAVRETSRAIVGRGVHVPFDGPDEPAEGIELVPEFP